MNYNQIQGKWKQFKGKVKEKWGELTGDEPSPNGWHLHFNATVIHAY